MDSLSKVINDYQDKIRPMLEKRDLSIKMLFEVGIVFNNINDLPEMIIDLFNDEKRLNEVLRKLNLKAFL